MSQPTEAMPNPRYFKYEARACLGVSGPDAQEFLQGQFSNDLSKMEVGQVVYGLWLDRKGKIVADSFVLRRAEESFLLISYFCEASTIHDRLDAYLVMEDAELENPSSSAPAFTLWGEAAHASVCEGFAMEIPERGYFSERDGVLAFWGRRGLEPCLEVMILKVGDSACIDELDSRLAELGARELSPEELAVLAIEGKVPQIGRGFGESDLPQELGLEVDAVSFRKGCYLGQEVMARLHAMGRVRKGLRVVSIGDATTDWQKLLPLDLLDESGKRQGQLRFVAYSESGVMGLAVVSCGFGGSALAAGSERVMLCD